MMQNKAVIIFGSSRSNGDTFKAIQTAFGNPIEIPMVDLNDINMSYYDYEHLNSNDDFLPLAEKMVTYDAIILATPVYWYTMSAIMKVFIDRWTDLLDIRKEIGRKLKGKTLYVIASHKGEIKGFEEAFIQTAKYMGMVYGDCYFYDADTSHNAEKDNLAVAIDFRKKVLGI